MSRKSSWPPKVSVTSNTMKSLLVPITWLVHVSTVCENIFASLCVCIHTAMLKKPVVTEVRTPTNTWSGLGFSKSMPAETIKELRRANHVPYKPSMSTTYEVRHPLPFSSCLMNKLSGIYCRHVYIIEDFIFLVIFSVLRHSVVSQNSAGVQNSWLNI